MQILAAANDALRAPREVGGTNDVTVSNRVNLVDPIISKGVLSLMTMGDVVEVRDCGNAVKLQSLCTGR